ncbi:MAG TPA: efflux RND transporter periplasmic adaptor subunit [Burkholderiales bacterium]|nr:efflux RND transporter periplasmic adaptor subunit [Burkholderiales bacterium]
MKFGVILFFVMLIASPARAGDDDTPAATPHGEISAAVQIAALRQQTVGDAVRAYGLVTVDSRQSQAISVPRAGQIAEMNITVGQRVSKGMLLLTFATSPEAASAYRQAEAAVQAAEAQRRSVTQLLQQQLATRSQRAAADKLLADAQASLNALQKNGAGKSIERLVAPFDALVSAVAVQPGDRVAPGAVLVRLSRSGVQRAVLGVEPDDAARVRAGMPVKISAVFGTVAVEGRIAQVDGQIDPQTQLVNVRVDLPAAAFLPGSQVRGEIRLDRYTATVVPRSAVLRDGRGAYLFQVSSGKAQRIAVRTGLEQKGMIVVSGDLIAGAPVVVLGNYELHNGMAVRIVR